MKFYKHINLLLLLIVSVSCNEDPGVLSTKSNKVEQFEKKSEIDNIIKNDFNSNGNAFKYNIDRGFQIYPLGADSIFLPIELPNNVIPELVMSKVIDGTIGGSLEIDFKLRDEKIRIKIKASLTIPPGAFSGTRIIWMVINNEIGSIWFYPHLVFSIPVQFDIKYEGIDLSDINPGTIDFIYQNNDGSLESVDYELLVMNVESGFLKVKNASLLHFSRYGWSR